jgi:hypothetical protein
MRQQKAGGGYVVVHLQVWQVVVLGTGVTHGGGGAIGIRAYTWARATCGRVAIIAHRRVSKSLFIKIRKWALGIKYPVERRGCPCEL